MDLFDYKPDKGEKYSLSQFNNGAKYRRYVAGSPPWKAFHEYIKSPDFISQTLRPEATASTSDFRGRVSPSGFICGRGR